MAIIKFRVNLTGSQGRDRLCGALSALAAWTLLGLSLGLAFGNHAALALLNPWQGLGFHQCSLGGLLLAAFLASFLGLSRLPRARHFLGSMVLTAAGLPPLWGFALFSYFLYCHV